MPERVLRLRDAGFRGLSGAAERLVAYALERCGGQGVRAALDLGCGTGDVAMRLHAACPQAEVTGVDFSAANIAAAQARAAGIGFVWADYMDWHGGPFDLVVSDGVLHLIAVPVPLLAEKLAGDLRPGGVLVATLPVAGAPNRVLLALRRLYRRLPSSADRLALAFAMLLYRDIPRPLLRDRLPYLRLLPRLFGATEQQDFAAAGLRLLHDDVWPSPSMAKLRHRVMVWRREG